MTGLIIVQTVHSISAMGVGIQAEQIHGQHKHQQWHWTANWIPKVPVPDRQKKQQPKWDGFYIDQGIPAGQVQKVSVLAMTLSILSSTLITKQKMIRAEHNQGGRGHLIGNLQYNKRLSTTVI